MRGKRDVGVDRRNVLSGHPHASTCREFVGQAHQHQPRVQRHDHVGVWVAEPRRPARILRHGRSCRLEMNGVVGRDERCVGRRYAENPAPAREHVLEISLDPRIDPGTHVVAVGYVGLKATSTQDYDRGHFRASTAFPLDSRDGSVLETVTPELGIHRGRSGLMVDIPFDGGMSGGPLIELCETVPVVRAIISGDVTENTDGSIGSGARSFASLLLPIAGLRLRGVHLTFPDGAVLDEPSVLELLDRGQIHHHGDFRDAIRVTETDQKVTVSWLVEAREG
jgi:hypothetical protein